MPFISPRTPTCHTHPPLHEPLFPGFLLSIVQITDSSRWQSKRPQPPRRWSPENPRGKTLHQTLLDAGIFFLCNCFQGKFTEQNYNGTKCFFCLKEIVHRVVSNCFQKMCNGVTLFAELNSIQVKIKICIFSKTKLNFNTFPIKLLLGI